MARLRRRRGINDLWNRVSGVLNQNRALGLPGFSDFNRELTMPTPVGPLVDWHPRADLRETDNKYIVHAELPAYAARQVDKDKIKIDVDGDTLTLSGETRKEEEKREGNYVRRERRAGTFMRQFVLPGLRENPDKVDAEYDNGVLTIEVAKPQQAVPKKQKIAIKDKPAAPQLKA
eukprot:tig00000821_g4465.t1